MPGKPVDTSMGFTPHRRGAYEHAVRRPRSRAGLVSGAQTGVLLYALSGAPEERPKRECAAGLIANENFGTSYQILMGTWVVATRKTENLSHSQTYDGVKVVNPFHGLAAKAPS
jgi:hypothetical protein